MLNLSKIKLGLVMDQNYVVSIVCGVVGGIIVLVTTVVIEMVRNEWNARREHMKYLTQVRESILNADFFVSNGLNDKILSPNAEIDINMFGIFVNKIEMLLYDKYLFFRRDEIEIIEKIKELMFDYMINALQCTNLASKIHAVEGHPFEIRKMTELVQQQKIFISTCSNDRVEWNNLMTKFDVEMRKRFIKA